MGNISKLETLVNLGFNRDPFKGFICKTGDSVRISRILAMAVNANAMVSIVGDRGSGKTRAILDGMKKMKVRQVFVRSADKSRLLITDIEQAMILDLSDEKPKRGKEIRARQLRRILGEASRKHEIVLVIEEGHRLHGMTLRALKTLREMDWMGETELFTIVLLGQSNPMNKAGVAEVRLRTDTIQMQGLTSKEINQYIQGTVGHIFEDEARASVSQLDEARNFLNLQNILVALMGRALAEGRDMVSAEDVAAEFGYSQKETNQKAGVSSIEDVKADDTQKANEGLRAILNRH